VFFSCPARSAHPSHVLTAAADVVIALLLTPTVAHSLLAQSQLPTSTPIPVTPCGSHEKLSHLTLVVPIAGSLPSHFLLASRTCCLYPVQPYIYAIFPILAISLWRWRLHGHPKHCYYPTAIHSIRIQKTLIWEVLLSSGPGIWWLMCSSNIGIHLSRNKAKQNKHLTLPTGHAQSQRQALGECACVVGGMVWMFSHIIALMLGTEMACETSVNFNHPLMRWIAQDGFINVSCHESLTSYLKGLDPNTSWVIKLAVHIIMYIYCKYRCAVNKADHEYRDTLSFSSTSLNISTARHQK